MASSSYISCRCVCCLDQYWINVYEILTLWPRHFLNHTNPEEFLWHYSRIWSNVNFVATMQTCKGPLAFIAKAPKLDEWSSAAANDHIHLVSCLICFPASLFPTYFEHLSRLRKGGGIRKTTCSEILSRLISRRKLPLLFRHLWAKGCEFSSMDENANEAWIQSQRNWGREASIEDNRWWFEHDYKYIF